jgi:DNA-binding response OmpR family regulator
VAAALTRALRSEGFDVLHAFNCHQAVAIYRRIRVDIVLVDLNMPVKNGWDIFERLNSINPLLPIIIIAGRPNQSALAEAAGVATLMEKPLAIQIPS